MNSDRRRFTDPRQGVALIIVLGLLAVMTISAVAFTISMRVERVAARHFVEAVRARHLVHAAVVRAMAEVQCTMTKPDVNVYPAWGSYNQSRGQPRVTDALCSLSPTYIPGNDVTDLFTGEARKTVVQSLHSDVDQLTPQWINLISAGHTNGRVAYIVVNQSGLIDANLAGGWKREVSTNIHEVALTNGMGIANQDAFLKDRFRDVRYETIQELAKINSGALPVATNFSVFSYDPDRDVIFTTTDISTILPFPQGKWWEHIDKQRPPAKMASRDAARFLHPKFEINSIVQFAGFNNPNQLDIYKNDTAFMNGYYWPLAYMIRLGLNSKEDRAGDIAWNVVNYLDPDRVPQGGLIYDAGTVKQVESTPWRYTEGGEALPLVNEIVFQIDTTNGFGRLSVELWYPFAPRDITPADNFSVQVGIFDNRYNTGTPPDERVIMNSRNMLYSWDAPIPTMQYGSNTEFFVTSSPPGKEIPTAVLPKYLLVRVLKTDGSLVNICDESMGYDNVLTSDDKRFLLPLTSTGRGYSVNDPRSNGQVKYWTDRGEGGRWIGGDDYPPSQHTLGTTNANCKPWVSQGTWHGQGLPIYMPFPVAGQPPMRNIGELGHIFASNLDDEEATVDRYWWRTINLMRRSQGAMLLDLMTVRGSSYGTNLVKRPSRPRNGLFAINSSQKGATEVLFKDLLLGTVKQPILWGSVPALLTQLTAADKYVSFYDMFTDMDNNVGGGGPLADAFRMCASASPPTASDVLREDSFRHICELVTFRQNIFTIIVAAQSLAPDGSNTPLAEKRAVVTVYRDAYTGRYFIRSLKWLQE